MEYVPGGTLKSRMGKPMAWQDAVALILPVAEGLEYAHQRGVLHRDVKPSNVLLRPTPRHHPLRRNRLVGQGHMKQQKILAQLHIPVQQPMRATRPIVPARNHERLGVAIRNKAEISLAQKGRVAVNRRGFDVRLHHINTQRKNVTLFTQLLQSCGPIKPGCRINHHIFIDITTDHEVKILAQGIGFA